MRRLGATWRKFSVPIEQITFDSSVVVAPSDRRFVMCCWERMGSKVPIVPAVAREMYGQLPSAETTHLARVLDGEENRGSSHYSSSSRAGIYEAVADATREWIHRELDAQLSDSSHSLVNGLRVVEMAAEQVVQAQRLSTDIPDNCFRTLEPRRQLGDRNVMAQAAVLGFSVLASHNRHSILRPEINRWMREEVGLNHDLVQDADTVIYELYTELGLNPATEQLKAVLVACLPSTARLPSREREIIDQFLGRLERGSFSEGAARCVRGLVSEEFVQYVDEIRSELPASVARETERRRISMVREAAERAGWERP